MSGNFGGLRLEPLYVDETGHNRDGKSQWLWGIVSMAAGYFSIEASRGKKVLKVMLADFKNTIVSDRYSAYEYFASSRRQLCWAHLKRDSPALKIEVIIIIITPKGAWS